MTHIASGLAAAILLVIAFMAAGIIMASALAATIAAGLIAWIVYRVARNVLSRTAEARRVPQDPQPAVPPPAA